MSSQEGMKIQFDLTTVIIGSLFISGIILTLMLWCGKMRIELLSTASGNQARYEACESELKETRAAWFELNNFWQSNNDNLWDGIKETCENGTIDTICDALLEEQP